MRPVIVGIVLFFIGIIGWTTFYVLSRILNAITGITFPFLTRMFEFITILSLPIAMIAEILLLLLGRKY